MPYSQLSADVKRLHARDVVRGMVPWGLVHLLASHLEKHSVSASRIIGRDFKQATLGSLERLPAEAFCQMLTRAAMHLRDPALGLRLGRAMRLEHLGALGYALQSCENLGQALICLERYHRLVHDLNPIQHQMRGPLIEIKWGISRGKPGALFDETGISGLCKLAEQLCGKKMPLMQIDFVNPRPSDIGVYQSHFNCPVQFGQMATKLVVPTEVMATPLVKPDPLLLKLMEVHVNGAMSHLPDDSDLVEVVRRVIVNLTKEGVPELEQVAQELRLSPRALYQSLTEQGVSFRDLRESALQQLAEERLRNPKMTLAEIAQTLGYSEQSAFTRAFKRWTGLTPTQWREIQIANH